MPGGPTNPLGARALYLYQNGRDTLYRIHGTSEVDSMNPVQGVDRKFLFLVLEKGKALRYGIGVGRAGFSWSGEALIERKAEWPDWYPPKEMQ